MTNHILIVGGTGFLGGALATMLSQTGAKLTILGRHTTHATHHTIIADWCDAAVLTRALEGQHYDAVINAGGYLSTNANITHETDLIQSHWQGTHNLLNALSWENLRCFIHLGSGEEYGLAAAPQDESSICLPVTAYGFAKLVASQTAYRHAIVHGRPIIIARPFLIYGSNVRTGLFRALLDGIREDREILLSPGTQIRDYLHVNDFVSAMSTILNCYLEKKVAPGTFFNVGSGIGVSVRDMMTMACQLAKRGKPVFGALQMRSGDSPAIVADIHALSRLKWKPHYSLETGLRQIIQSVC